MPTPLTLADLQELQDLLNRGKAAGGQFQQQAVLSFYAILSEKGYGYASWAAGVAGENTIAGISAVEFLKATATPEGGPTLSQEKTGAVKAGMAQGYLTALKAIARDSETGAVERDVSAQETWSFHDDVFHENGLSIENWTLYAPFVVLKQAGQEHVDSYWEITRDTKGEGPDALFMNIATWNMMVNATHSPDPSRLENAARPNLVAKCFADQFCSARNRGFGWC